MTSALQTFMSQIVDYAGLFPPAQLPLPDALVNYHEYRQGAYSWMLGRFVIPAARLEQVGRQAGRFTALGKAADDADAFLEALRHDVSAVRAFTDRCEGVGMLDTFEVRLPESVLQDEAKTKSLLTQGRDLVSRWHKSPLTMFYEVNFKGQSQRHHLTTVAKAVAEQNRQTSFSGTFAGIKLRTGGTVAEAFPSAEQLSRAIVACRDAGVPFKCTAGLHHPFRRYDKTVNTKMHGFVNVFGGAALAYVLELDERTLTEILLDEDGHHFRFADDRFGWRDLLISRSDLEKARRQFAISFGSCSFTEPIEDLQSAKLL
jgi:hypothetical protein